MAKPIMEQLEKLVLTLIEEFRRLKNENEKSEAAKGEKYKRPRGVCGNPIG